jgi:hypothetical protein
MRVTAVKIDFRQLLSEKAGRTESQETTEKLDETGCIDMSPRLHYASGFLAASILVFPETQFE